MTKRRFWNWKRLSCNGDGEYMHRFYVIPRNRFFNIYLHKYYGPDDMSLGLHDHPWHSLSFTLWGRLYELRGRVYGRGKQRHLSISRVRVPRIKFRRATDIHAVEPVPGSITLFITGPKIREWGFWNAHGEFTDNKTAKANA